MSLAARPGTAVEPLCSIASTASPSCRANAAASCSNWPSQGWVVVHDGDGGHARSVGTRGWLLSQTAVEAEISAFPVGESPMAHRHPASNPSRTNQAGLSMTPQEVMLVMRCHAIHGRRVRSERNYEWRSRWLSLVVGLGGLEPPASSLSAITRSPLCRSAFSQVVRDRRGLSNALLRSRPAQRTDRPPRPRDKLEDQPRRRQGDGAAGWARQPHRTGSSVLLGGAGQGRSLGCRVP
jgi:hypothetical protein